MNLPRNGVQHDLPALRCCGRVVLCGRVVEPDRVAKADCPPESGCIMKLAFAAACLMCGLSSVLAVMFTAVATAYPHMWLAAGAWWFGVVSWGICARDVKRAWTE